MQNLKLFLSLLFILFTVNTFSQHIHHELNVKLSIKDKSIDVIDTVTIPGKALQNQDFLIFSLNKNIFPVSTDKSINITEIQMDNATLIFNKFKVEIPKSRKNDLVIPIKYSGSITDDISTGADEYARGFSETTGTISDAGAYLAGSTYWIPSFEYSLLTFNLTVTLPGDWNVVSQGERVINEKSGTTRKVKYQAENPTEEVYLVAAAWTEYEQKSGDVLFQAFLRTPDSALAYKYIDATSDYLNMYVKLIGPYPYSKFALVENFWETGYGMPSFTLLGEKIIRFPWILFTSYPHELLHNWWGNSVYVDFEKGNWCEGLTAYMADHLLKEQEGQGADYRRTTLQKYTDYVNAENDFPVIEFRSRNNAAEEAIGYGKCLMFNHMLRKMMGDDNFIQGYKSFYQDNIYKISTFDDIQESLQKYSPDNLKPVFEQWLTRKGAPSLALSGVTVKESENGFDLSFSLSQTQPEDIFVFDVPVAVYLDNQVKVFPVASNERTNSYTFSFLSEPLKIEVDPQFDVFRRLDRSEVPPSLSQVFGSKEGVIILPKSSRFLEDYRTLAETWQQTQEAQGNSLLIVMDEEIEKIPDDKSVWVIGFENKFARMFKIQKDYHSAFSAEDMDLFQNLASEGSLVYAVPNPENKTFSVGFVGTYEKLAIPGLTRLLSHYGKYSYLGFEGERPNNVLKGNFPALNSPLSYTIPYEGKNINTKAVLAPDKALVD